MNWMRLAKIITAVVLVFVFVSVFIFWRYPFQVSAWMQRRSLSRAGFDHLELRAPTGRLSVWEKGSGEPLILLHGLGDQAGTWVKVVGDLPANYHLLILDFPGHRGSDPAKGTLTLGMMLDALDTLIQAKCAGRPAILVGNSMGAWVAMVYGHRHPGRVARIVAVNGGAVRFTSQEYTLTPKNREEARRLNTALFDSSTPTVPDFMLDAMIREANNGPVARLLASESDLENYVLDGKLGELKTPVNLLWGGADKLFPLPYAGRMEFEIPAARLTIIENCGHIPQRECPARFSTELVKILSAPTPEPCSKCGAAAAEAASKPSRAEKK